MSKVLAMSEITPRLVGVKVGDAPMEIDNVSSQEFQATPNAFGCCEECSSVRSLTGSFSLSSLSILSRTCVRRLCPPFAEVEPAFE